MKHQDLKQYEVRSTAIFENNVIILEQRFPNISKRWKIEINNPIKIQQKELSDSFDKTNYATNEHVRNDLYCSESIEILRKKLVHDRKSDPFDIIFFIGIGIGILPIETISKAIGNPRIIVIEPSTEIFSDAIHFIDLEPLLSHGRVDLYVGDDVNIATIVERYKPLIPLGRNRIVVYPKYEELLGKSISEIRQSLTEHLQKIRDVWYTTKKYGRRMLTNTITNLPSLFLGAPFRSIRNKFEGASAICIAAGPSLNEVLPDLSKLQSEAILIACDSAVSSLLKVNICPHIVVTTDIFETNFEKIRLHIDQLRETILIFGIESNPNNVRLHMGPRRIAVTAYSRLLINWLDPDLDLHSTLPEMTSVGHMAVFTAMAIGASNIILSGMDLAYTEGHSHASGSVYYHSTTNKKGTLILGSNGSLHLSSPQFLADRLLLEKHITNVSAKVINTCLHGTYINGASLKSMPEVVSLLKTERPEVQKVLDSIQWDGSVDLISATTEIQKLINGLKTFISSCKDHESHIRETTGNIRDEIDAGTAQKSFEAILRQEQEIQNNYSVFIDLLYDTMLNDVQLIRRQEEVIAVRVFNHPNDKIGEELNVMLQSTLAYQNAGAFLLDQLADVHQHLSSLSKIDLQSTDCENEYQIHLSYGRCLKARREIWRAVQEFEKCLELAPNDPLPYIELFNMYKTVHLMLSAQLISETALTRFPDAPEIKELKAEIDTYVNDRFSEMKKKWIQGDMSSTRILLNEFLMFRPDDPQAKELKRVIKELDHEFSSEWRKSQGNTINKEDFQKRLDLAVSHLENMDFERSIGVLYGLISDYPDNAAVFYEKIGEYRMLQKDFHSAGWNFSRALELDPGNKAIEGKIKEAALR